MEFTELGWAMLSFITLTFYLLCMFDFPTRRGRHLHEKYNGIPAIFYSLYAFFFFCHIVVASFVFATFTGTFLSAFGSLPAILGGIFAFAFFIILTIRLIDHRSNNELFLLRLKDKFPLVDSI